MRLLLAFTCLLTGSGCTASKCNNSSECNSADLCVVGQNVCRKRCTQPIDCAGDLVCSHLPDGQYACLAPAEIVKLPAGESTDTTLGNPCFSPNNDGRSKETATLLACGEVASLCTQIFGPQDVSAANDYTCTTECSVDGDCAAEATSACTGDCKAAYDNLCCIPPIQVSSGDQYTGARKSSANSQVLTLYCRPRTACYLVPKRCTKDADCGGPTSRAGAKCTTTTDGGGSCISGKLGMYECCQREGECDQDTANSGVNGLSCAESLDRLSAYCTKPCTSDADCRPPAVPNASPNAACWSNTFELTDTQGKCRVRATSAKQCRNQPMPMIPNPPDALVNCDFTDRPLTLPDNKYDTATRRCQRTF